MVCSIYTLNLLKIFGNIPGIIGGIEFDIHKTQIKGYDEYQVLLHVETELKYPCYNYDFLHDLEYQESTIKVFLGTLEIPGPCATLSGPASFDERLDLSNGEYLLEIYSIKGVDSYRLTVIDNNPTIEPIRSTFSKQKK